MKLISKTLAVGASVLVLSCSYADRHAAMADGSGDEIIVKFTADQAVNETIVRAFDEDDAERSLQESIHTLSNELGVPFVYSRVTSGREIVVEIPTRHLIELVAERIRESDNVQAAIVEIRDTGDLANQGEEILVTVDSNKIDLARSEDLDAIAARLVSDDRFPVNCSVREDGRLAIEPDFKNLVGGLVNKLQDRPDIDYAQPNFRVRHYNNNP